VTTAVSDTAAATYATTPCKPLEKDKNHLADKLLDDTKR